MIAAAIARIARLAETRRKRNNLPKIKGRSRVDRLGSVLFRLCYLRLCLRVKRLIERFLRLFEIVRLNLRLIFFRGDKAFVVVFDHIRDFVPRPVQIFPRVCRHAVKKFFVR